MRQWYVIQTRIRMEDHTVYHLRNQGFEVFLPRYVKTRRHARRVDTVLRPMFPGYMFVCMDISLQRWRSINGTIGVVRLMCAGNEPLPVPGGIIEEIMLRADADGTVSLQAKRLEIGDRVRILRGAFAECEGLFEELVDENRVILLLDLLGRKVRAQVRIDALDVAV